MKSIIVQNGPGVPLPDIEIASVERQLGVSLPSDYAAFLREHNGGRPEPYKFPIAGFSLDNEGILSYFLGINQEEYNDFLEHVKVFDNRVPSELLPIGRDPFGNLICLAVSGPNKGTVYWWFHEEEADEGEPPTYDNLYFVANSFSELLDSLTEAAE